MAAKPPAIVQESPPAVIGHCVYCDPPQPLYAEQPTTTLDEPLSHVGCAVHARRVGERC